MKLQVAPRKQTGFKKSLRGRQIRREDGIARGWQKTIPQRGTNNIERPRLNHSCSSPGNNLLPTIPSILCYVPPSVELLAHRTPSFQTRTHDNPCSQTRLTLLC